MAKSGGAKKERGPKSGEDLVRNRKAGYEYEILETLEAGMVLTGTEVKSLRDKKASLAESYVRIDQGEIFWIKGTIEEYSFGNVHNHASQRKRKLLLRKSEIRKLLAKVREKGLTLIPPITGTAFIIIMAFIIRSLPVGVRSGITSLQQIDPTIEEAASVLGASSRKVFTSITIPMIKNAFLNGLIFTFARSMTLVSTVIFLISARYKLLTTTIMAQIDVGKMGVASAYCTLLIIIVSTAMLLIKLAVKNISTE